eukprot:gene4765-5225_t
MKAFFAKLVVLLGVLGYGSATTCAVADSAKVDCGYVGINQSGCESKGCCWVPAGDNSNTPWCFYGALSNDGYTVSKVTETSTGFEADLSLVTATSTYGADVQNLKLQVVFETSDIAHVKITDGTATRWEVPESIIPRPHASARPETLNFDFSYTSSPFTFEVTRKSDGRSVFKLDSSLIYKDQYLEFSTSYDSNSKTYGLGESTRLNHALQTGKTYTMWAADIAALAFNRNLYGAFPFYLQMIDGKAHGAMLMNSNGLDVTLLDSSVTFKAQGGIIDLYIFTGGSPLDVVNQYTSIVGRPTMMPYWSLGFHNCKYGYTSLQQVEEVVANYSAANIPLDTQWMDIDYMQNYRDFTFDSVNFPQAQVASFVDKLHNNGQHFVPIVDPGIMVYSGYEAYDRGVKEDLFIKDLNGNNYLGQVWPGPTYFPDFLNPGAQSYWTDQIKDFHNIVPADGIWIDMNEVSNFCNSDGAGQVCVNSAASGCPAPGASQTDCCLVCSTADWSNKYDFPPYAIANSQGNGRLGTKTLPASAVQYGNVSLYNSHNLYGLTEQIATNKALVDVRGKRPFLLTRSSFLSSGAHTAKWTGDNGATWDDLKSSIISIMDFNIFGVPMVGADICGFIYDTTEELCARWIEVGAFYPFSRNHNAINQAPQELYLWPSVTQAAQFSLGIRYQLLPYLYTRFYEASQTGALVVRALWANFADDSNTIGIEGQFMLGAGILISPVLDQGATAVSAYFAKGNWYRFGVWAADSVVDTYSAFNLQAGQWLTLSTPLTTTNVHVRGGNVLPLQQPALTTTSGRATPFTLVVALCPGGKANGNLFWDDGEQVEVTNYLTVSYHAETSSSSSGVFTGEVENNSYDQSSTYTVQEIVVLGIDLSAPSTATLNGVALESNQIVFDSARASLRFSGLSLKLSDSFKLLWN